jgi:hypothetical protein
MRSVTRARAPRSCSASSSAAPAYKARNAADPTKKISSPKRKSGHSKFITCPAPRATAAGLPSSESTAPTAQRTDQGHDRRKTNNRRIRERTGRQQRGKVVSRCAGGWSSYPRRAANCEPATLQPRELIGSGSPSHPQEVQKIGCRPSSNQTKSASGAILAATSTRPLAAATTGSVQISKRAARQQLPARVRRRIVRSCRW